MEAVTPNIICDPKLVESVMDIIIRGHAREGDLRLFNEYHSDADRIYDRYPVTDRNDHGFEGEFEALNHKFFGRLGLLDLVRESLNEYPAIAERVEKVVIKKSLIMDRTGADLVNRTVNFTLTADLFEDPSYLKKFMRHELMHVMDMLDESFGYEGSMPGENPAEEFIVSRRYGVIWDIYITSRLERMGKESALDKEGCMMQFEGCYADLPVIERRGSFEALWQAESLTHRQIAEMAGDAGKLLEISIPAGDEVFDRGGKTGRIHLAGALCPICRFPTHRWFADEAIEKEVRDLIVEDLPVWNPGDGACERCIEVYKLKAGRW